MSKRIRELPGVFIHESAYVDAPCEIGEGTKVWHFAHIQPGARIGRGCSFGQNVNVGSGVVIGDNVKVQNNVSIYTGAVLEDDVFLGPSCVLTNVTNPRSQVNRRGLYEWTLFRRGATVGANATIVCGITLGRYCFIAAGSVVTKDVPDYALIVGSPGRQQGWMSRHGHRLHLDAQGEAVCPESGFRYRLEEERLRCLDLDEDAPLPVELSIGERSYDELREVGSGKSLKVGFRRSDFGSEESKVGSRNAEVETGELEVGSVNPEVGAAGEGAGGEAPSAESNKPEARGETPAAGGDNPEAGGKRPKTGSDGPEAGGEDPEAWGVNPGARGEKPQSGSAQPDADLAQPSPEQRSLSPRGRGPG